MSRPEKKLSEQELLEIETMAGIGLSFEDIALIKGICDDTLKKYATQHLKRGKAKANAQVMQTAYRMAMSGKIPSMTMFWLKTQVGWREGQAAPDSLENNLSNLAERINQSNKPSQALQAHLAEVLDQLKRGVINPKVASSIASLSNILLKATEQGELEERLASLERVIQSQDVEPLDLELDLESPPDSSQNPARQAESAQRTTQHLNPAPSRKPVTSRAGTPGNISKRLKQLETNLTPKRFTLNYLEQLCSCANEDDLLRLMYSDEFGIWFDQSLDNMRASVQRGVQDPWEKEKASQKAHQELAYLYSLASWPSEAHEALCDHASYEFIRIALLFKQKPKGCFILWSEAMKSNFRSTKRLVEHLWLDLKVAQLTVAKISHLFFDGHPLLMNSQQQFLDHGLDMLERLMDYLEGQVEHLQAGDEDEDPTLYTWWHDMEGASDMRAFLEDAVPNRPLLLQEAERQAESQFLEVKRQARIAVYEAEGRHDEVRKIYQQMLNGNSTISVNADFVDL